MSVYRLMVFGSCEIWNDKLKLIYNKVHRVTEWTEVKAIARGSWWHKDQKRCSVQIFDNFWDKCFGYKVSNKTDKLSTSLPRTDGASVSTSALFWKTPYSPFPCVTFCQRPKLRQIIITLKCWRPFLLLVISKMVYFL